MAAATTTTYLRAASSLRDLRLEIDPSSERFDGSHLALTLLVATSSQGRPLTVERLDLGLYLNGRFVASESVIAGVHTLRGGDRQAFDLAVSLRPDQAELIRRQEAPRRWRAEGLLLFRVPGMRRAVQRRVSTR